LRKEGRVNDVKEVVTKGQKVKIKVLNIVGKKISLSMKVNANFVAFFLLIFLKIVIHVYF